MSALSEEVTIDTVFEKLCHPKKGGIRLSGGEAALLRNILLSKSDVKINPLYLTREVRELLKEQYSAFVKIKARKEARLDR